MTAAPFRVALRVEGKWWVAYIAEPATMKDATEIARVLIGPARADAAIKRAFIDFAQLVVSSAAKAVGVDFADDWNTPVPAPEGERSGNA